MSRSAAVCTLGLAMLAAVPAAAQVAAPGPPGPYVIDIRGATSAIPIDAGLFPPVPAATILPSRGYGVDVGAHVYLLQLGPSRLGIGASVLRARGTASPAAPTSGSTSGSTSAVAAPATKPVVDATLTILAPQISFNFGSAQGWSYVSLGLGRAQLKTGTSAYADPSGGTATVPAESLDSGTRSSINIGGGARWFRSAHLAFSFDVRIHMVSAGEATGVSSATPRTTLVAASAGVSLR